MFSSNIKIGFTGTPIGRGYKNTQAVFGDYIDVYDTWNGRAIGRIEPMTAAEQPGWNDIMAEVWRAQKTVKAADRVPNPVLHERQRRRR